MRVLFDIGHPADVHFFKHVIFRLRDTNNKILVLARDKDVTLDLLTSYQISFINKGKGGEAILDRVDYTLKSLILLLEQFNLFKPDLCLSHASPYLAVAARIKNVPHIMYNDTENAPLFRQVVRYCKPIVYLPDSFQLNIPNAFNISSFKELAYLHPNQFTPETNADTYGEKYILIRLVSNQATHDRGINHLQPDFIRTLVHSLSGYGNIHISSESDLPADLQPYEMNLPPADIHNVISNANLVIGDSATMSAEAAMLGVPSIFINDNDLGYITELQNRYGLVKHFKCNTQSYEKAVKYSKLILESDHIQEQYFYKRNQLLAEKKDMTELMLNLVNQVEGLYL